MSRPTWFSIAFWCCLLAASPAALSTDAAEPVRVRNLPEAGALQIENSGPAVRLNREIHIEQLEKGQWQQRSPIIHLAESCTEPATAGCVDVKQGETITPVKWSGFTCRAQCPTKCKKNAYLGPGEFRFVVSTCDKSTKFYSEVFSLPEQPEPATHQ
jgi:hypothetical protein